MNIETIKQMLDDLRNTPNYSCTMNVPESNPILQVSFSVGIDYFLDVELLEAPLGKDYLKFDAFEFSPLTTDSQALQMIEYFQEEGDDWSFLFDYSKHEKSQNLLEKMYKINAAINSYIEENYDELEAEEAEERFLMDLGTIKKIKPTPTLKDKFELLKQCDKFELSKKNGSYRLVYAHNKYSNFDGKQRVLIDKNLDDLLNRAMCIDYEKDVCHG